MKPCLFVFCSVQRESLLQRWKRQVQRHGSVLGIRHEERCLPSVSGKCRFLVLIDFSSFLLLNYCRIHIHTCRVGKLFLPLWCVHACHGASWTPKRSCSAFYPSERHADSCFLSLSDNEEQRKGWLYKTWLTKVSLHQHDVYFLLTSTCVPNSSVFLSLVVVPAWGPLMAVH